MNGRELWRDAERRRKLERRSDLIVGGAYWLVLIVLVAWSAVMCSSPAP